MVSCVNIHIYIYLYLYYTTPPILPQAAISERCFALKSFFFFTFLFLFTFQGHAKPPLICRWGERESERGREQKKERIFCIFDYETSCWTLKSRLWLRERLGMGYRGRWWRMRRMFFELPFHSETVVWVRRTWQKGMGYLKKRHLLATFPGLVLPGSSSIAKPNYPAEPTPFITSLQCIQSVAGSRYTVGLKHMLERDLRYLSKLQKIKNK